MRRSHSWVIVLAMGLLAAVVAGCGSGDRSGSGKKEPPLPLARRLLRNGELIGYDRLPSDGRRPAIGKTTVWKQFLKNDPFIPDYKKAAVRLASLRSDFVRAAIVQLGPAASLPPPGLVRRHRKGHHPPVRLPIPSSGGFSAVAQFRSADAASKALGMLDLEGYAPCPEKCDVRARAVSVPDVPGAKGVRRSGHSVENGKPFLLYQVLFSDGPFVYGVSVGGQPNKVHVQPLLTAAKNLYDETKGHPAP